jgi:rRNA maturation protein Nop10
MPADTRSDRTGSEDAHPRDRNTTLAASRCPMCGSAADEVDHTTSWGSRTRLLVCRAPTCGQVATVPEPPWRHVPRP